MSLLVPHPSPRQRPWFRALLALALALGLHGVFVLVVLFLSLLQLNVKDRPKVANAKPVMLRPLSADSWNKNRGEKKGPESQTAEREKKPDEKKKEEKRPDGQVVAVAPGNNQESPDAKHLAETSNAVKKETRAKETTANYRNAMPQQTATEKREGSGSEDIAKPEVKGNRGMGQDDRPLKDKAEVAQKMEVPDVKARTEVAMRTPNLEGPGAQVSNRSESEAVQGNSDRLLVRPGVTTYNDESSAGRAGEPGKANLMPSSAVVDRITGAAANDHLENVDEGEGTFLNTREWKFASFFNRVKQSVGMHWNPAAEIRLRDPTGQIYGTRDRYTVLNVTLDEKGRVRDVFVEKSCGVDFLDLEAVHSFERAQPFPNPPPGLLATDGQVRFNFGFFLEMSGSPRMRLFRGAPN